MALHGLRDRYKAGPGDCTTVDLGLATKLAKPPVKLLGFTVRDAAVPSAHPSPPPIKEASLAEESGDSDSWILPTHWQQGFTPFQLTPGAASSSSLPASIGFKGFKDCCEAGSFSLEGNQVLQENGRLEVVGTAHTSAGIRSLVKSVVGGLRACQQPEPSSEGLGGTYFFLDESGRKKAIVKPCDEEPLAPNNPKGFVGRALGEPGLKPTVRVGEAAMREVAAFLLDYDRFARVPYTVLVRVTHSVFHVARAASGPVDLPDSAMSCSQASASSFFAPDHPALAAPPLPSPPSKLASLQEFMQHHGDASEMGCSRFSVADVHRIGILDLRLFNTDRHAGNMLVRRSRASSSGRWLGDQMELIPIDHGFCLPEALEPPYLEWLHWPQAMIPFDHEELAYISHLDAANDVEFLQQELPWLPEGSLRTLQVATLLLTKCAAAGLTLAEIGTVASRPLVGLDEEPSQLETVCLAARAAIDADDILSASEEELGNSDSDSGTSDPPKSPMAETSPQAADAAGGLVMGMQVPLQSTISGDELLFELEEEEGSSLHSPERHLHSPRNYYTDSRSTGSEKRPLVSKSGSSREAPEVARSLATGMLHHRASRPRNRQFRSNARSLKSTPKRRARPVYPPPVVGMHQSGMNSVFDGLEGRSWGAFIEAVGDLIEEALDRGIWKKQQDLKGTGNAAFGTSCPRF